MAHEQMLCIDMIKSINRYIRLNVRPSEEKHMALSHLDAAIAFLLEAIEKSNDNTVCSTEFDSESKN